MRLNTWSFALGTGLVLGGVVFLATVMVLVQDGGGHTLGLLKVYYLGYSVSWGGSIVGLFWGFVNGFVAGAVIALVHNLFAKQGRAVGQAPKGEGSGE